ncbi:MAG: choice-of-anchor B family protein [Bacteroidetes bacterium]|nr:MAG: choice-of-anchor B family protein [Bacteroidota bacterium]
MTRTFFALLLITFSTGIFAQLNMSLLSSIEYNTDANDIWGWADPDDGTEYAIVGLRNGVSIVSLADPEDAQEVVFIPGQNSIWRDIKTWGNFAYVTTDQNGTTEGLTVIDLSDLPNSAPYYHWTPSIEGLGTLETCHNIYIDEFGYAYLAGCNLNEGGMLFIDVFSDPGNPTLAGLAPNNYAHDVFVRDNKMYAAEIYEGRLAIYDVNDKLDPSFLGGVETPFEFTHNVWLSEDGNIAFTTDEKANAPVASYDVSDPENIIALDEFRPLSTQGLGVIPHNVHVWGEDWLVISYYTDGGIIADASRPDNIIEVGNFDTFLGGDGGFSGAWGLYPFLPSGIVLVSDINNGLFVLDATYVHACWLEGNVIDAQTGQGLFNVEITIETNELYEAGTDLLGNYKTGLAIAGTYDVIFSKEGYYPQTIQVNFQNGVLEILDIELEPYIPYSITGLTFNDENGNPVEGAQIFVEGESNFFEASTNNEGEFELELYQGTYNLVATAWGYNYTIIEDLEITGENSITINLQNGYQDDFVTDLGWESTADDAETESGFWVRDVPVETVLSNGNLTCNPGEDVPGDFGDFCFMTGNGGGDAGNDDVDGGDVYLTSPVMDLSEYIDPVLSYRLWWVNESGFGAPNDNISVYVSNGLEEVLLETVDNSVSLWRPVSEFHLNEYLELTENMRVTYVTGDQSPGNVVEAAVDAFSVTEVGVVNSSNEPVIADIELKLFPNPFSEHLNIVIELEEPFNYGVIEIFNAVGQKMDQLKFSGEANQFQLGETLVPGIYFTRVSVDGNILEEKRVVKTR